MKILVFGAGAIGSYVGSHLILGGNEVTFLEKGPSADIIRSQGLRMTRQNQVHVIRPVSTASSLGEALEQQAYDVAVVAVKSYDTSSVVEDIRPYRDGFPPVLCVQNGVENEARLSAVLGEGRVLAGTVTSSVSKISAVGEIVVERQRGAGIAAGHLLSEQLVNTFNLSGLPTRLYPDARQMKWSKMFTNLPANATAAILDMTPAEILAHPGLFQLEMLMMREALLVMRRLGFNPVDLPGVPVRALAFAVSNLPLGIARLLLRRSLGSGRGGKMPSFHIDLHSGKGKSEVKDLNGAVVRTAFSLGLTAPVNALLTQTLLELTEHKESLGTFTRQPEKLLRLAGISS